MLTSLKRLTNFQDALDDLIKRTIKENQNIIFNGNGYSDEWPVEAEKRGLLNLKSTPEAVPTFLAQKNVDVFSKYGVYTEAELQSRVEILLDEYCKTLNIEALTMIDMAKKEILPAAAKYIKDIAKTAELAKSCGAETVFEEETVKEISALVTEMYKHLAHWKLMYRKYTLSRTHRKWQTTSTILSLQIWELSEFQLIRSKHW